MSDNMTRARMIRFALTIFIAVAILDFTVFFFMVAYYGGVPSTPAFKPIPATEPYFLDDHGRLTEVSRQIFSILMWQYRSLIFLWPLAGIFLWFLRRQRQRST
jgi:hypothetical protein